ncbi:hypothetical protein [Paraburkholderia sp.]|uniref:hypothetical protein n=1 Tax=Paraburkholderia sp. TaxID=1926495 RepID=UPI002D6DA567|nr:hypothetical protein [Paraburkholderia sp.]HZZ02244.1 hypothetical protein [Paraburkholderia sp.]
MGFLAGKRILLTGLLSNRSIAYGIAHDISAYSFPVLAKAAQFMLTPDASPGLQVSRAQ